MIDHRHDAPITLRPFPERPCRCVSHHNPQPLIVEQHHVWPQAEQIHLLGSVQDGRTVALCSSGHDNVHMWLAALERGETLPRGGNAYLKGIARRGYARATEAIRVHGVPFPDQIEPDEQITRAAGG